MIIQLAPDARPLLHVLADTPVALHIGGAGLALAPGSFAGQTKAQPAFLRDSPWLIAPALIVLAYMLFWPLRGALRRRGPALAAVAP